MAPTKPRLVPGLIALSYLVGSALFLTLEHFSDIAWYWTLVPFLVVMLAGGAWLQTYVRTTGVLVAGLAAGLGGHLAMNGGPGLIGLDATLEFASRLVLVALSPVLLGAWLRRSAERATTAQPAAGEST